jgi:hypothetical protein
MGLPTASEPGLVHDIHCYLLEQEERGLIGAGSDGILQQEFCCTELPDGAIETLT